MAKVKYDGVIEAVHYNADGQVDWVRGYLRRGAVFSDRVLLDRQQLIDDLKAGKNYLVGKRSHLMGATFEVSHPLRVVDANSEDILVVGETKADHDHLEGVPII